MRSVVRQREPAARDTGEVRKPGSVTTQMLERLLRKVATAIPLEAAQRRRLGYTKVIEQRGLEQCESGGIRRNPHRECERSGERECR